MKGLFYDHESSALKIVQTKKRSSKLGVFLIALFIRDHDKIQTCNLLSRNHIKAIFHHFKTFVDVERISYYPFIYMGFLYLKYLFPLLYYLCYCTP